MVYHRKQRRRIQSPITESSVGAYYTRVSKGVNYAMGIGIALVPPPARHHTREIGTLTVTCLWCILRRSVTQRVSRLLSEA